MTITKLFLIFTALQIHTNVSAAQNKADLRSVKTASQNLGKPKSATKSSTDLKPKSSLSPSAAKIKLKANEYSMAFDSTTKIISTKLHEGLLLSANCFKKSKPACDALTASLKKPAASPTENLKSPYHNNFGANHCGLIGGSGRIAKDNQNNETDFCEFKDGSLVSSWTAYYKVNPIK